MRIDVDAYNLEFQTWINASKEGRVDGPGSWDGYVGSITAAASKARDTQTVVTIDIEEMPDFLQKISELYNSIKPQTRVSITRFEHTT